MGDLISRSAFEKFIKEKYKDGESTDDIKDQMLFDLSYQPTAYNVDKVVEQLADEILCDGCSNYTNCFELNKRSECGSYKAIEKIVKEGGVE